MTTKNPFVRAVYENLQKSKITTKKYEVTMKMILSKFYAFDKKNQFFQNFGSALNTSFSTQIPLF